DAAVPHHRSAGRGDRDPDRGRRDPRPLRDGVEHGRRSRRGRAGGPRTGGNAMKEAPEHPPRGPEAFASLEDPEAVQAQAAILLAVACQMRGDRAALQARSAITAQAVDMYNRDELEEFPIP